MNTPNITTAVEYSRDFITVKNQIYILYSQAVVTFCFPVIAAVCLAWVLWEVAFREILFIWLALVMIHAVIRYFLLWKYHHDKIVPDNADIWLKRFLTSVLISGILWGVAGIILVPYENTIEYTLYNGLTLLITCGLVSGALISYSINIWVIIAYSFPALIPPAVHLISLGDQYNSAFGGFLLLYYFFIGVAAARMNRQFHRYLEMEHQQKELIYKYERLKLVYTDFRKHLKH
ncbi:MAG: hypothetical protein HW386_822 [Gammaproteobacteria bacterium]|nr:hypothetical protein [Gammaproteobacteria bacterium]